VRSHRTRQMLSHCSSCGLREQSLRFRHPPGIPDPGSHSLEATALEFRWEIFNLTNTVQFGFPNRDFSSSAAGTINPRQRPAPDAIRSSAEVLKPRYDGTLMTTRTVAAFCALLLAAQNIAAWGVRGHTLANLAAVEMIPSN